MGIPPQFRDASIDVWIGSDISTIIPTSGTIISDEAAFCVASYSLHRLVKILSMRKHNLTKRIDIPFPALIGLCR